MNESLILSFLNVAGLPYKQSVYGFTKHYFSISIYIKWFFTYLNKKLHQLIAYNAYIPTQPKHVWEIFLKPRQLIVEYINLP